MAEITGVKYRKGHEGFFVWGLETGMLEPDVQLLPAAPTLQLGGYASVPGMRQPEGTQPIRAVGMRKAAAFLPGRREPSVNFSVNMGSGNGPKKLLQAALSTTTNSEIAAANRHMCLPVLALGGGAVSPCHTDRSYTWLARYCLINSLTFNLQFGQPVQAQISAMALALKRGATVLDTTLINETNIKAAGGRPFGWQHISWTVGNDDFTPLLNSLSIQISNNITRDSMRKRLNNAGGVGDANALSRTSRSLSVGNFDLNLNLGLRDKLPAALVDGSDTATDWSGTGALEIELSDGLSGYVLSIPNNFLNDFGQNEVQAEGEFSYSGSTMSDDMIVTYI